LLRGDLLALAAIELAQRLPEPRSKSGVLVAHLHEKRDHELDELVDAALDGELLEQAPDVGEIRRQLGLGGEERGHLALVLLRQSGTICVASAIQPFLLGDREPRPVPAACRSETLATVRNVQYVQNRRGGRSGRGGGSDWSQ
jgi:hypothetical protein